MEWSGVRAGTRARGEARVVRLVVGEVRWSCGGGEWGLRMVVSRLALGGQCGEGKCMQAVRGFGRGAARKGRCRVRPEAAQGWGRAVGRRVMCLASRGS